jgi:hypothetical protein
VVLADYSFGLIAGQFISLVHKASSIKNADNLSMNGIFEGFAGLLIAIHLGRIFGRGPGFSLFWLTLGSPIGMFMIARQNFIDTELLNQPAAMLDIKSIRRRLKKAKTERRK